MAIRRLFLVALAAAILNYVLPQSPAWADGVRGTAAEEADYSQREAQAKGLEEFVGGDALGIVIAIIIIAAIVVLVYFLIEHHHGHARAPHSPDAVASSSLRNAP